MNKQDLDTMIKRGQLGIKYLIKRLGADYNLNDFKVLALFEDIMIELSDLQEQANNRENQYKRIVRKMKGVNDEHLRKSAKGTSTVAISTT